MVCTGIPKTNHVGCGLTGHDFVTDAVTGLEENLTTLEERKTAAKCGRLNPDFGMMCVVRGVAATSAKRGVSSISLLTKVSSDSTLNMTVKIASL